jgi:hypothetical protein
MKVCQELVDLKKLKLTVLVNLEEILDDLFNHQDVLKLLFLLK